ncbi:transmembrane 4 L6 family member 19 [Willisornis vidua]|uniref:Transmembrane 4 L6 family member 19 n=1 Tax=Willisornis vidua TaxID=1566151 RepID=A0ABQ9DEU7_9PASS|nr:transmembrane 4 L6 family member 19 [Willisornis vidua]
MGRISYPSEEIHPDTSLTLHGLRFPVGDDGEHHVCGNVGSSGRCDVEEAQDEVATHRLPGVKERFPSKTDMCVGKCSRIVGPCLLTLGMLSAAANILLLFPGGASKYLLEGHISRHAVTMPGVWGGGIPAFISTLLSKLAFLGAAACFVLSGVGLTNGPLCLHNTTEHGLGHGAAWGYPFPDAAGQGPDARAKIYLYNQHTWNTCLEPEGIVAWNVVLFSVLLLISVAEMVLSFLQILNGCLGCLCGFCEGK